MFNLVILESFIEVTLHKTVTELDRFQFLFDDSLQNGQAFLKSLYVNLIKLILHQLKVMRLKDKQLTIALSHYDKLVFQNLTFLNPVLQVKDQSF